MTNPAAATLDVPTLAALAAGIIPPDEIDAGAQAVNAGARLADKVAKGASGDLYRSGIAAATDTARARYGRPVSDLAPEQLFDLLAAVRETNPAFFKQLRADVSALYLSDPQVWQRIGFPGPSADTGGYPDFDQRPAGV